MGLMLVKKFSLLFLLISSSLLITSSFAGGGSNFVKLSTDDQAVNAVQEVTHSKALNEEEERSIQERLLRANARDYGRYDPSPTFSKPPYKLIPN